VLVYVYGHLADYLLWENCSQFVFTRTRSACRVYDVISCFKTLQWWIERIFAGLDFQERDYGVWHRKIELGYDVRCGRLAIRPSDTAFPELRHPVFRHLVGQSRWKLTAISSLAFHVRSIHSTLRRSRIGCDLCTLEFAAVEAHRLCLMLS
jgi:hypothetical protein